MTKVSNLSADSGSNDDTVDLQLALAQHLSGLKEFGVTILPAAKGESFEIATPTITGPVVETSQETPTLAATKARASFSSEKYSGTFRSHNFSGTNQIRTARSPRRSLFGTDRSLRKGSGVIGNSARSCRLYSLPQAERLPHKHSLWFRRSQLAVGIRWRRPRRG